MTFLVILYALVVPGIISTIIMNLTRKNRKVKFFEGAAAALAFDALILGINMAILVIFKHIYKMEYFMHDFKFLGFTYKYIALSVLVAAVLGVASGLLLKFLFGTRSAE